MCFKKTTIFACRCFLRDTFACPHSACLAEGDFERSRMEQLAAEMFAHPLILPSMSSSIPSALRLPPGIAPPPGFSPPPPFSPNSASSASSSPDRPATTTSITNTGNIIDGNCPNNTITTTNAAAPEFATEHEHENVPASPDLPPAQDTEPPCIINGLFYERRMGQIQRAVHWNQWRTEWFPCAAYHSTHLDTVINTDEEYMNCPEHFGNEDKEVQKLGLCEECRGVHQDHNGVGNMVLEGGDGRGQGQGQVQNHGLEGQTGAEAETEAGDDIEPGMREI